MIGKKGDTHLLFKWIFGAIAGAIILAFFIKFSYVHLSGSNLVEGNRILFTLENKLDALGIREGSDLVDLKDDFEIGHRCGYLTAGSLENGDYFERKTDKIIFSSENLHGRYMNTWMIRWEFPYYVGMAYYLNRGESPVLIIGPTGTSENFVEFVKRIPSNMNARAISSSEFNPGDFNTVARNSEKITIVYFDKMDHTWETLKQTYGGFTEVEVVLVKSNENVAKIYDKYGNVEDVFYLGDEMLYGLIFSGSGFTCNQEIAIERLKRLNGIYLGKVGRIMTKETDPKCIDQLNEGRKILENFQTTMTGQEYYRLSEKLEELNKQLKRDGCSTIY